MKFNRIVAATDFSELSVEAVKTALRLSQESGATLFLVHVLDLPPVLDPMGSIPQLNRADLRDEAMKRLQELVPGGVAAQRDVRPLVLDGRPSRAISLFARQKQADMIVVGTHGRTGLDRMLVGSTAEGLLRQAPCPVLVVKGSPTRIAA